jgi:hypothetical protein
MKGSSFYSGITARLITDIEHEKLGRVAPRI